MDRQDITFKENYIHPEEEPNINEINEVFLSAKNDLEYLDKSLIESANNYNNLLTSARLKILNIKELLIAEKERQQDINILCNKYSDFSSVINLKEDDFSGTLTFKNNILQSRINSAISVDYKVESIDGNGFAGNKYVYLNNDFLENIVDTTSYENIKDSNLATSFEYARITTSSKNEVPLAFNKDSIEAECSVILSSDELFNHIELFSERDDLILKEVYTSLDGLTYELDKEYNISINNRNEIYNDYNYIYGSGIITVEPCRFIKIVLRSNGYSNDNLAYVKTFFADSKNNNLVKKIEHDNLAKRHLVKINDIKLFKNSYSKGMIISRELITSPVKCISLYCNAYINHEYSLDKNVSYYLIINGKEYEILPVNCNTDGKKIIRMSSQVYKSDYVIYLNEEIKSAKLKIVMNASNSDITPYVSDIKILIGGNE